MSNIAGVIAKWTNFAIYKLRSPTRCRFLSLINPVFCANRFWAGNHKLSIMFNCQSNKFT